MGLMEKFKNLFTDEEVIEDEETDTIEIKEVKKEEEVSKLPTFMREKIEKEEKKALLSAEKEELKDEQDDGTAEEVLPKLEEKSTFKFPIDLAEDDFVETRSRQSIHHQKQEVDKDGAGESLNLQKKQRTEVKVADLYKDKKPLEKTEKPRFKATPIISPIYGILDKNYTSGDIASSTGNNYEEKRHSKSVDFDSVRKKAYGDLSKEIKENLMCENCEYLKEAKECKKEKNRQSEYSYEILDEDVDNSYNDITIDEATENYYDYGVEYEKEDVNNYQDDIKINTFEEEKEVKDIPPVKSSINLLSTLKKSMGDDDEITSKREEKLELTDDLFNLIDSMYDERNED